MLSPWHPFLLRLLYEHTRFPETQNQLVEYMAKLQSTHDFTLLDYTKLEDTPCELDDYFDSRHFSQDAADRVLEGIL
jgi:hypothetical protein